MGRLRGALVLSTLSSTLLAVSVGSAPHVAALSNGVVISQVYGGGGNTGATFTHDFVELFNRGTTPVSLNGWAVQYASATGTGNLGVSATQLTELPDVTLQPGQYFLVQEATNAAVGSPLPTPDVADPTPIAMAAGAGKVALANTTASLGCNGSTGQPCNAAQLAQIIDFVGYGNANFFEGAGAAPTLTSTTAALRSAQGCTETDNNSTDFAAALPTPRNTATTLNPCTGTSTPALSVNDVSASEGNAGTTSFNFTVSLSFPAGPGGVTFDIATADGGATTGSNDYVARSLTGQTIAAGSTSYAFSVHVNGDVTSEANETFFVNVTNVVGATVTDGQGQGTIVNDDVAEVAIHDIQGAAHLSPLSGQLVRTTPAVVTAVRRGSGNGFYIQDVSPDASDATSEGIFVFTSTLPTAVVGQLVQVTGTVTEFGSSPNLTITQLSSPVIDVLPSGSDLPSPVVVGAGGRVPPTNVIDDDSATRIDITTAGSFDAATDGIDFYESLEGMRVQVNDVVASGPTSDFGSNREIPVVGAGAEPRTPPGGVIIEPGDFNPERIILNDWILGGPTLPAVHVGAGFTGATVGVVDYSFGNYKLQVTALGGPVPSTLTREVSAPPAPGELSVATFNVENLAPSDPPAKFATLADLIVNNLGAPDLVALEEIQDNNGTTNDTTVDASATYAALIAALQAEGGVTYQYRQIDPVDDQDGGAPGGNIRQAFLFRTDRGLSFVDRAGGTSTTPVGVTAGASGPELTVSPGRIEPASGAFASSRKPLAGEFTYNGRKLFVVGNHFNSKGGDEPLFGRFQPPALVTEAQRVQQATLVADFVGDVHAIDPSADVIVLGDINDFEFSPPMAVLKAAGLTPLIETLPANERYTYVFQGNSQSLDHILMSSSLTSRPFEYDSVHVNAEFADQASDHDPQVVRVRLNAAPTVDAGGPYSGVEGTPVTVSATGSDPDGSALTYAWDLDGNGTFETPGQTATVIAPPAPTVITITVKATDPLGLSATDTATVQGLFDFSGFFGPVDNFPTANVVTAGQAIPVRFSLGGNQGLAIFAAGYPKVSGPVSCTSPVGDPVEETSSAGGRALQYNPVTDQYTYVWKTQRAWAGTCRILTVKLTDGTTHEALFRFR